MADAARGDVGGRPDEHRDVVLRHLELALAGDRGPMVGDDHEDGVLEPGLGAGRLQEGADGMIGVGDAPVAAGQRRRDAPLRPRVGPVVGSRHDEMVEGPALGVGAVRLGDGPGEGVLVARPPGIGEGGPHAAGLLGRTVHHAVAVGREEIGHIVEEPVAAVDERRVVAVPREGRAQGTQPLAAVAAQDGLAGNRGDGEG